MATNSDVIPEQMLWVRQENEVIPDPGIKYRFGKHEERLDWLLQTEQKKLGTLVSEICEYVKERDEWDQNVDSCLVIILNTCRGEFSNED